MIICVLHKKYYGFEKLETCFFKFFYFIFLLLPVVLIRQFHLLNNNNFLISFFVLLTFTSIGSYLFYKNIKDIKRYKIRLLNFYNIFIITVLTIFCAALGLYKKDINIIFYLLFISPLLILQLVYKRIELDEVKE